MLCKHEVVGSIPSGSTMGPMVLRPAFDPVWLHHGAWRHWLVRKVKEICGAVRENPAGTGTRVSCSFVSGMRVFEIVKREWIRCGSYLKLPSSSGPAGPSSRIHLASKIGLWRELKAGLSDCLHTFCRGGAGCNTCRLLKRADMDHESDQVS